MLRQRQVSVSNQRQSQARGSEGRACGTSPTACLAPLHPAPPHPTPSEQPPPSPKQQQQQLRREPLSTTEARLPPQPTALRRGPRLTPTQPFGARPRTEAPALALGRVRGAPQGRAGPDQAGRVPPTAPHRPLGPRGRPAPAHARAGPHSRHSRARTHTRARPPAPRTRRRRPRPLDVSGKTSRDRSESSL